jgi:RNA recognition motif-containing protein
MLSWITSSKQTPTNGVEDNHRMSFTVFLGNLPAWVTADDIKGWLSAESLVADAIKVIRNPETQESKGFAFIDAPNVEEMNAIIRRFDRAPLEDRLLRANPAQPPKPKGQGPGAPGGPGGPGGRPNGGPMSSGAGPQGQGAMGDRPPRRARKPAAGGMRRQGIAGGPQSAFAEELAKAL